ncbi:MAG: S1C family serine protease [Gammaproteobacteria bacterium]|nr:S1C family serine protease [Gammaproteobacteria bacterium]
MEPKSYSEMDSEQEWRDFLAEKNKWVKDKEKNFKKGVNRREFLLTLGLIGVSGKLLTDICVKEYNKHLTWKIYNELPNYIYKLETSAFAGGKEQFRNGMGIVVKNHYLTMAHIVDFSKRRTRTPFGIMEFDQEVLNQKVSVNKKELEQIIVDTENDIAIYKLPKDLELKEFPCKPTSKRKLGDEVFLIGNPYLQGWNIRRGYISDLDDYGNQPKGRKCFGINFSGIPGDSGTPVVNSKYELLGLQAIHVDHSLGYTKKIEEYLKYIK